MGLSFYHNVSDHPMGRRTKSNVPQDVPLKWNVEKAAAEFGLSIMTLRKALAKTSAAPDADGLFSTQQVAAAIYGSMHIEKLATQKELRRKLELENAITTGSVLDRAELMKGLAAVADAMVSRIKSADVSRSVKDDLLRELASVPIVLEEVAHRQTRFPHGNGKHPDDDESES
jgi:hypothetical protein